MKENISIIGIGKLGLCLALTLEDCGYNILGCDINEDYVNDLNKKTFFSNEKGVNSLLRKNKNFKATISLKECLDFSNIIFLMVATPSLKNGKYDHTQIENVIFELEKFGKQSKKKLLIVGCTTYPGYCESIKNRISKLNFDLLYNPEFIAQGNILWGQTNPDMVLIGESSKESGDVLENIHKNICKNTPEICRLSLTEAEITKIGINCFITTKISFANMIGDICNKLSLSTNDVLSSISKDSRIGSKCLRWGYGFGGPCFPRDNRALGILCDENNIHPSIPLASDEYNRLHLNYQLDHIKKSIINNQIMLEGVSYKPGSVIIEESQQLLLAKKLSEEGVDVTIVDNETVISQVRNVHGDRFKYVIKK